MCHMSMHACMHACMHDACMYVCMFVCLCLYVCMQACMMHACMFVCLCSFHFMYAQFGCSSWLVVRTQDLCKEMSVYLYVFMASMMAVVSNSCAWFLYVLLEHSDAEGACCACCHFVSFYCEARTGPTKTANPRYGSPPALARCLSGPRRTETTRVQRSTGTRRALRG